MNNLALGKYVPGNSFIHRLDPRIKILAMILLMVAIFWSKAGFIGLGFISFFLIIILIDAKVSFKSLFSFLKYMWLMLIIIFLINIFSINTGPILFTIPYIKVKVYQKALFDTLYVIIRLILMVAVSTTLTFTTKPLDLTSGLESLMKPLRIIRFPVHEVAMMISIALRFIPTLLIEAQRIMKAQASRGVDIQEGKFFERINGIVAILIPLFVCAFLRSEELAEAMEARGYDPSAKRTKFRTLKTKFSDYLALGVSCCILVGIILIGMYQKDLGRVIYG